MTVKEMINELKDLDEFFNMVTPSEFLRFSKYTLKGLKDRDRTSEIKIERHFYSLLVTMETKRTTKAAKIISRDHATVMNSIKFIHSGYIHDVRVRDRIKQHFKDFDSHESTNRRIFIPFILSIMDNQLTTNPQYHPINTINN